MKRILGWLGFFLLALLVAYSLGGGQRFLFARVIVPIIAAHPDLQFSAAVALPVIPWALGIYGAICIAIVGAFLLRVGSARRNIALCMGMVLFAAAFAYPIGFYTTDSWTTALILVGAQWFNVLVLVTHGYLTATLEYLGSIYDYREAIPFLLITFLLCYTLVNESFPSYERTQQMGANKA